MLNEERISVFHCDCGVGLRSAHGSVIRESVLAYVQLILLEQLTAASCTCELRDESILL